MTLEDFRSTYIQANDRDGTVVATITVSHLTDDQNVSQLGRELFSLVEKHGYQKFVLDLSTVQYVTSSVLGKFITLHRKLHRRDGKLILCGFQKDVRDVLQTSKLLEYFNAADDVDAAIAMLQ